MFEDEEECLRMKLKSVTKLKLSKINAENLLRNTELIMSDELQATKTETEFKCMQLEDLKKEVAKVKFQIAMIGICEVSEKSKIDNHISNFVHHQDGFDKMFLKENEATYMKKMEMEKRKEEEREMDRIKQKEIDEKHQLILKETALVEEECDAIEQECAILQKRNNAIRLKLRRKLIESEDIRRTLMKNAESSATAN